MTVFHIGSTKYKSKLSFQLKTYQCLWGHFILAERVSIIHIFTPFTFSKYTDIFQAIKWVTILFPFPGESNTNSQDTNSWSSVYPSNLPTMCLFVPVLATPHSMKAPPVPKCALFLAVLLPPCGMKRSTLPSESQFKPSLSLPAVVIDSCRQA